MIRVWMVCLLSGLGLAAQDPWTKVRELAPGAEIRIYKTDGKPPVQAKFAELTNDNLVVVVKNEQLAVARDAILRLDARPEKKRVRTESRSTSYDPGSDGSLARPQPRGTRPGPGTSTSSGVTFEGKAEFETIYTRRPQRPASAPKQ
jgi:hypothetical protein